MLYDRFGPMKHNIFATLLERWPFSVLILVKPLHARYCATGGALHANRSREMGCTQEKLCGGIDTFSPTKGKSKRKSAFGVGGTANQEPVWTPGGNLPGYSDSSSLLAAAGSGPNCTRSATTLK
jgi:hypothetical protein